MTCCGHTYPYCPCCGRYLYPYAWPRFYPWVCPRPVPYHPAAPLRFGDSRAAIQRGRAAVGMR